MDFFAPVSRLFVLLPDRLFRLLLRLVDLDLLDFDGFGDRDLLLCRFRSRSFDFDLDFRLLGDRDFRLECDLE